MVALMHGNSIVIPGSRHLVAVELGVGPKTDFDYQVKEINEHKRRADSVFLRGFNSNRSTFGISAGSNQDPDTTFVSETTVRVVLKVSGQSVEVESFQPGGLDSVDLLSFAETPQGLEITALETDRSQVEKSGFTAPAELQSPTLSAEVKRVLLYIDQTKSMSTQQRGIEWNDVKDFFSGLLPNPEYDLFVCGSSATVPVITCDDAESISKAMDSLTPCREAGWGRSLSEEAKNYDRVVVFTDSIPCEADLPNVVLVSTADLPESREAIQFDEALAGSVRSKRQAELGPVSKYFSNLLYKGRGE